MNNVILGIKDKYPLIDFAKYGTKARLRMHPDLLIGSHPICKQLFKEGDVLDANAVYNLILANNDALGVTTFNRRLEDVENSLVDTQEAVRDNREAIINKAQELEEADVNLQNNINSISSSLNNTYTKQQVDAALEALRAQINNDAYKHVFMTQSQYAELQEYDDNTIYFLWDDEDAPSPSTSFPYSFPIVFGSTGFPHAFPVVLG